MRMLATQLTEPLKEHLSQIEEALPINNRSLIVRMGLMALTKLEKEQLRDLMFETSQFHHNR